MTLSAMTMTIPHPSLLNSISPTPDQAANMHTRAALMQQIAAVVKDAAWTQAEAAKQCRVTQPRMNDLLRGRIANFSLDALVNMAAAIGWRVHVELKDLPYEKLIAKNDACALLPYEINSENTSLNNQSQLSSGVISNVLNEACQTLARGFTDAFAPIRTICVETLNDVDIKAVIALLRHFDRIMEDNAIKSSESVSSVLKTARDSLGELDCNTVKEPENVAQAFGFLNVSYTQKRYASKTRKKTADGKKAEDEAFDLYKRWSIEPLIYKNKAAFNRNIVENKWCDDIGTANRWLSKFIKTDPPSAGLLAKLPKPK